MPTVMAVMAWSSVMLKAVIMKSLQGAPAWSLTCPTLVWQLPESPVKNRAQADHVEKGQAHGTNLVLLYVLVKALVRLLIL